MKLDTVKERIKAAQQDLEREAPPACQGCSNLERARTGSGRVVLSCLLDRAANQKKRDGGYKPNDRPTALWVARSLFSDALDARTDTRSIDFRSRVEEAKDGCPIVERVIAELPGANAEVGLNLDPPDPVLSHHRLVQIAGPNFLLERIDSED